MCLCGKVWESMEKYRKFVCLSHGKSFCSPFAIITMHYVETAALEILKKDFNFSPTVDKRYLDDIF